MKKIIIILFCIFPILGLAQNKKTYNTKIKNSISLLKPKEVVNITEIFTVPPFSIFSDLYSSLAVCIYNQESIEEYEAIVFDTGFETFLATQKSSSYYSETYLKGKNRAMVTEWNIRHSLPSLYNPDIYEVNIDYNPTIDYGLDVEYTLYMFFCFMEKQNKISLITSNT
ncbi:DUF6146 family protein [Dysgonomonas sp. BGC7]|uniref:DUF6146 family protein n=1 Tax=Dysgonomonas sp. BGC7 TaxID=1658008 RepID=UPI000680B521|nr:DUF6146 family protein [Dysgonomonas sp. BGC7]MBD8389575.1 hypothetical protein [Dysgonomonas sp. BGC7]